MSLSSGVVLYGKDNIEFEIVYSERKTLEISVHPNKSIVVKAPAGSDYEHIQKTISKRAGWINRQVLFFEQFYPRTPERLYVGGETHLYLGKRYRLKIFAADKNEIKMIQGFFHASVKDWSSPDTVRSLMNEWYANKAKEKFNELFEKRWPAFAKMSLSKPIIKIRQMKRRWGSLSVKGTLTLNENLICAPKDCIDYVITHELCHLKHNDHGKEFYRLLSKILPDWEKRKKKLEQVLI